MILIIIIYQYGYQTCILFLNIWDDIVNLQFLVSTSYQLKLASSSHIICSLDYNEWFSMFPTKSSMLKCKIFHETKHVKSSHGIFSSLHPCCDFVCTYINDNSNQREGSTCFQLDPLDPLPLSIRPSSFVTVVKSNYHMCFIYTCVFTIKFYHVCLYIVCHNLPLKMF